MCSISLIQQSNFYLDYQIFAKTEPYSCFPSNHLNLLLGAKSLGYHSTWPHNECCVRFSKSDVRPSAGFSARFRDHTGRRETRLLDKGSECVRYQPTPTCPICTKIHLHCTQIAVPGTQMAGQCTE